VDTEHLDIALGGVVNDVDGPAPATATPIPVLDVLTPAAAEPAMERPQIFALDWLRDRRTRRTHRGTGGIGPHPVVDHIDRHRGADGAACSGIAAPDTDAEADTAGIGQDLGIVGGGQVDPGLGRLDIAAAGDVALDGVVTVLTVTAPATEPPPPPLSPAPTAPVPLTARAQITASEVAPRLRLPARDRRTVNIGRVSLSMTLMATAAPTDTAPPASRWRRRGRSSAPHCQDRRIILGRQDTASSRLPSSCCRRHVGLGGVVHHVDRDAPAAENRCRAFHCPDPSAAPMARAQISLQSGSQGHRAIGIHGGTGNIGPVSLAITLTAREAPPIRRH